MAVLNSNQLLLPFLLIIGLVTCANGIPLSDIASAIGNVAKNVFTDGNNNNDQDIASRVIELAVLENSKQFSSLNTPNQQLVSADASSSVQKCSNKERALACRLFQKATKASHENGKGLLFMPWNIDEVAKHFKSSSSMLSAITSLIGMLASGGNIMSHTENNLEALAASSPVLTVAMMCNNGSSPTHCLSANMMRSMLRMTSRGQDDMVLVNAFLPSLQSPARGGGGNKKPRDAVDLLCRRSVDGDCSRVVKRCRRAGLRTVGRKKDREATAVYGMEHVRCRVKAGRNNNNNRGSTNSPRTRRNTDNSWPVPTTTELPLPPTPTDRHGTEPFTLNIDGMELSAIINVIHNYYAPLENALRTALHQVSKVDSSAKFVYSAASAHAPKTASPLLSAISDQIPDVWVPVRKVFNKAWKTRLVLKYNHVPRTPIQDSNFHITPDHPRPPANPHPRPPFKPNDFQPPRWPRWRRQTYYNPYYYSQCSSQVVNQACSLLDMNNQGTIFLLPWILEDLFTGSQTSPSAQSATPLSTIIALCSGQKATTYYGSQFCPSGPMLTATTQASTLSFQYYTTPSYVSSIVGNPSYARYGQPSSSHFSGTAVDFLCGPYIYNPSQAADSCPRLSANCYQAQFRNAYFPAQDGTMGCGSYNSNPITLTHCSL